jgi:hypothetical protein
MKTKAVFSILAAIMLVFSASVFGTGEEINWQVLSGGGTDGSSTSFMLRGTVGQTATGSGGSDNFGLRHGFWQEFEGGGFICDCVPGEANETPPVNILDIVYLINFKYKSGPSPVPYALCNGDPNTDCTVNILDIVYLINFKYKTGPAPKSCEQWVADCGLPLRK